jgi:molybdopterin synthase sulfur carrier subunit
VVVESNEEKASNAPVGVAVLFFGPARELAKVSSLRLQLPRGSTVLTLRNLLAERFKGLEGALPGMRLAVNLQIAGNECRLREGDEVALIPPVSGG